MSSKTQARRSAFDDPIKSISIAAARRLWVEKFRAGGIDSPELDARILIGHALSLDHAALTAAGARVLEADELDAIAALAVRRLAREPVARILGWKEFWGLPLQLDATTLVPRPETETIVEAALAAIAACDARRQRLQIADLGTGTGAILMALLCELPNAEGVGTDISPAALLVARDNARRLGLRRARFVACDMSTALRGPFDLVVCNPPYVASAEIARLAPEVRDFEPWRALDGGRDGLDFYRSLAASAPALLAPGGMLIVELGVGQEAPVAALFAAAGLAVSPARPDLSGVPRALLARWA